MRKEILSVVAAILASAVLPGQTPPQFKVAVEYVEVEARVLDENAQPLRHLTQDRFQLLEDGVAQNVTAFTEIDLPVAPGTVSAIDGASRTVVGFVTPDVSTNARQETDGRIYLILFDDQFIAGERAPFVRRLMKGFVERNVGPNDLVAVSVTGRSAAFQNFTNNKALLAVAIDRVFGEKDPSPTVAGMTSLEARAALSPAGSGRGNAPSPEVAPADKRLLKARSAQDGVLRTVNWMAGMPGRSKSIILVGEGVALDELNDLEGVALAGDARKLTEGPRRGSIPIYTIDPRGSTTLAEESIQVGTVSALTLQTPADGLRAELRTSQDGLRRLAEDTGGIAAVGTNDFDGAFDRIVGQTSSYYVLGYYSSNPKRDGTFRSIQVKVSAPNARIITGSGYTASSARSPAKASFPGPAGASQLAREALSSPQPMSSLMLSATAAPFKGTGAEPSVAVVLESSGADLVLVERNGTYAGALEVLVVALEPRGAIKASETKSLQFNLPPETFQRVQQHGFRWLSRLSVKPGTYQIRVAAVSGSSKQGSVWYDLVVPDFSDDSVSMSGVLIASASAFRTPTLKPDRTLDGVLPGPPTTTREFPPGDELTVFAEVYDNRLAEPHELDVTVTVRTESGREVFRKRDTIGRDQVKASRGVYRSVTPLALNLLPGRYLLAVEAGLEGQEAAVRRELPFRVRGNDVQR